MRSGLLINLYMLLGTTCIILTWSFSPPSMSDSFASSWVKFTMGNSQHCPPYLLMIVEWGEMLWKLSKTQEQYDCSGGDVSANIYQPTSRKLLVSKQNPETKGSEVSISRIVYQNGGKPASIILQNWQDWRKSEYL